MDAADMYRVGEEVGKLVTSLIHVHRGEIQETWAETEDAKQPLSFSVKLSGAVTAPKIDVKMSFSKKFSDEASVQLDDEAQGILALEKTLEESGARIVKAAQFKEEEERFE